MSGLVMMPDARVAEEGTFRLGNSRNRPYSSWWSSISLLPRAEGVFDFTKIAGVPGFPGNTAYGDYKDKVFGGKFVLFTESGNTPAVAVGMMDVLGTGLFKSRFLAASKQFGDLDLSLGVGGGRINGVFGGARYAPAYWNGFGVVGEYDANDYAKDKFSNTTGVDQRKKGQFNYGLEYRWGMLGAQLARQNQDWGMNAYVSIPLEVKEWIPKFREPEPFVEVLPRPTEAQWRADASHVRGTIRDLLGQDFRQIQVSYSRGVLSAKLTNSRISMPSRAVGRAARVLLAHAPLETHEIRITYTVRELPVTNYTFINVRLLQRYFNGEVPRSELAKYVVIESASPEGTMTGADERAMMDGLAEARDLVLKSGDSMGDPTLFQTEDARLNRFGLQPHLAMFLNDPSGAFHYDFSLFGTLDTRLAKDLFMKGSLQLQAAEDVSDVTQPSNSLLPHVRSDVAEYKRDAKFKLNRLLLNKFYHLAPNVYARTSAGIYEEMFSGAGGQVLYAPERSPWAVDVAVDALAQRDTRGWLGLRDYRTVTAITSVHYRLAKGLTVTARAGEFLAKDKGVRMELARRFKSGVEFGGWYTITNGNDITSPGTPTSPYYDKGVFISIPFSPLSPQDTRASTGIALSPWTRDVGQMVVSPEDLYGMLENPLIRNRQYRDGLAEFGDVEEDDRLPSLGTSVFDRPLWNMAKSDADKAWDFATSSELVRGVAIGAGVTALATVLDRPGDHAVTRLHLDSRFGIARKVGNAVPFLAMAASGALSMQEGNRRLNDTALASMEAGLSGALLSEALKFGFNRARPETGMAPNSFGDATSRGDSSFPSLHATVAWAAVTPYAKEYNAPWLYGVAALTNYSRMASRKHWFSDTVAGSAIGYGLGSLFWEWRRNDKSEATTVMVGPQSVLVNVPWR
ncbi:MAG: phosphatase PAP2 family protein [Zoogloea sp.]|nr:phosphatase PAP2 family protein [Zoogloea sp.]